MELIERDQHFFNIRGQVAKILLEHATNSRDGHNRLAQRDIAKMLGTGWDMVHLSLKSLYHDGVIRIDGNRIIVNKELTQKATEAV